MVVWCTQNAPRRQQFHVAPAMSALKYITSLDIKKMHFKKLVTHVESHVSAMSIRERRKAINNNKQIYPGHLTSDIQQHDNLAVD